jgi:hypothetical protein
MKRGSRVGLKSDQEGVKHCVVTLDMKRSATLTNKVYNPSYPDARATDSDIDFII